MNSILFYSNLKRGLSISVCSLLLSLPILLFSCSQPTDDDPPPAIPKPTTCDTCLPDITTTGKSTFGCKVNGKIWLPKGAWGNPATGLSYYNEELGVFGYNDTREERVGFAFSSIIDTGFYDFSKVSFTVSRVGFSPNLNQADRYRSEPANNGYLNILRFEPTTTGIVSGTFAFDAYNANGDTIHITDGRFDLYF